MQQYGKTKTKHHVEGHQDCGICHPNQGDRRAAARRETRKMIEEFDIVVSRLDAMFAATSKEEQNG
jgi:hypothetical protein